MEIKILSITLILMALADAALLYNAATRRKQKNIIKTRLAQIASL